jgi:hypothetical protein
MTPLKTLALAVASLAVLGAGAATASAQPLPAQHPRRAEVAQRLHVERLRIEAAEKSGRITPMRAAVLLKKARHIRREARFEARAHGGVLTRVEQRRLNREETRLSHDIARRS